MQKALGSKVHPFSFFQKEKVSTKPQKKKSGIRNSELAELVPRY